MFEKFVSSSQFKNLTSQPGKAQRLPYLKENKVFQWLISNSFLIDYLPYFLLSKVIIYQFNFSFSVF